MQAVGNFRLNCFMKDCFLLLCSKSHRRNKIKITKYHFVRIFTLGASTTICQSSCFNFYKFCSSLPCKRKSNISEESSTSFSFDSQH